MDQHGKFYNFGTKLGKVGVISLAVVGAVTIAKKISNGEIKITAGIKS